MARTFFFGILVYLFAVVCAVPAQIERALLNPAEIINALGIGIVSDIHVTITVCAF
jgi:hypothetical protein